MVDAKESFIKGGNDGYLNLPPAHDWTSKTHHPQFRVMAK